MKRKATAGYEPEAPPGFVWTSPVLERPLWTLEKDPPYRRLPYRGGS